MNIALWIIATLVLAFAMLALGVMLGRSAGFEEGLALAKRTAPLGPSAGAVHRKLMREIATRDAHIEQLRESVCLWADEAMARRNAEEIEL